MNELALLLAATLSAGTPLAIAGLGLLVNERAGVLNLGAEGMMLIAAVAGFAVAFHTGSDWLAFAAGAGAGALAAALFGVLTIWLGTNQYATGLALSLFGGGFSAFVGIGYVGKKLAERPNHAIPVLSDMPFLGTALFRQHPMVYIVIAAVALAAWVLYRTRAGRQVAKVVSASAIQPRPATMPSTHSGAYTTERYAPDTPHSAPPAMTASSRMRRTG